jgi:hypothetical protein
MREIPRQAAELKWIPGLALQGYAETIKNPTVPFFSYHPPESAENTQILLFFFLPLISSSCCCYCYLINPPYSPIRMIEGCIVRKRVGCNHFQTASL